MAMTLPGWTWTSENAYDVVPRDRMVRDIVDAAMSYVSRGWYIVPVAAGGRKPLVETRHMRDAMLPDWDQMERWWRKWPYASIGVLTGQASGLVVVSSPRHRGARVSPFSEISPPFPRTVCAQHAWNRHYYFAAPGVPVRSRAVGTLRVYGDDGVAVVPPASMLLSVPVWEVPPSAIALAAAPAWLLGEVSQRRVPAVAMG